MSLAFRFAIVSDLHIALPHTIWDHPSRFHLVEVSIPALERVFDHLSQLDLDFLLLPGDLTQHGEVENHEWLVTRLSQLPFPTYVIPGNHDVPYAQAQPGVIAPQDFPYYYQKFGYDNPTQSYYTCEVLPGVRLIGLNSNQFDEHGKQRGRLDDRQLDWLRQVLHQFRHDLILVMVHHNIVEHLPGQSRHTLGRRYILENASTLLRLLQHAGARLVFTGHLHIQDIASRKGVYDITTGSLVSYPHPYRVLNFRQDDTGKQILQVESHRVESVPGWPTLQHTSREWMGDRSFHFMVKLLTHPPINLSVPEAERLAPDLRYFWANIADGDAQFQFPQFPEGTRQYFEAFSAIDRNGQFTPIDNTTTLLLSS